MMKFKSKYEELGYYIGKNLFFFTKRGNNKNSDHDSHMLLIIILTLTLMIFVAVGWYMFFGNFPVDGHKNYYYKFFEPNRRNKTSEYSIDVYPNIYQTQKTNKVEHY